MPINAKLAWARQFVELNKETPMGIWTYCHDLASAKLQRDASTDSVRGKHGPRKNVEGVVVGGCDEQLLKVKPLREAAVPRGKGWNGFLDPKRDKDCLAELGGEDTGQGSCSSIIQNTRYYWATITFEDGHSETAIVEMFPTQFGRQYLEFLHKKPD